MSCDRCPAVGLVKVEHQRDKTTLTFCGHHADAFAIPLLDKGFIFVRDDR